MSDLPPTDRPLTAGDVPLLREGDVLRCIKGSSDAPAIATGEIVTFIRPSGSGGISKCIVTSADEAFGYRPGRFTFVSRPATSAASEGDGADTDCVSLLADLEAGKPVGREAAATIRSLILDRDAALASPPVSERERELEGALEWALDQAGSEHPYYPERADNGGWQFPYLVHGSPMGGGVGHAGYETALKAVQSARTWPGNEDDAPSGQYLTAQPAGEGK